MIKGKRKFRRIKTFSIIFGGLFTVIVFSCANPFSTRPVETPDNNDSNYELPTDPKTLLNNISTAFWQKDEVLYKNTFQDTLSSDFYFYYLADIANLQYLGHWNIRRELDHFSLLTRSFQLLDLKFGVISEENHGDSILVRVPYDIKLDNGDKKESYRGEALFKMKYYLSYLVVYGWEDFKSNATSGDSTWSRLKWLYD